MTCFRYLLTNTLFLTGQWSSFVMSAISLPLLFLVYHNRIIGVPLFGYRCHKDILVTIILNRCKYDLVFPCAVTIAVKLGVKVIFTLTPKIRCVTGKLYLYL